MLELQMSRLTALGLVLVSAALGACADSIVSAPEASMTIVAGDGQSGTVGRSLSNPLVIKVATTGGVGVPGVAVAWTVTMGGGSLSETSVLTDAQGAASVTWTLGDVVGTQSVSASVAGLAGSPAIFSASAAAVTPAPIVIHYNGTACSTALEDINGARVSLTSIWGATASAMFAVGGSCAGNLVLQYDGSSWGPSPPSCVGMSFSKLT